MSATRTPVLALALVFLLLPPPAAAISGHADSLRVDEPIDITGTLRAFARQGASCEQLVVTGTAAGARIEIDHADMDPVIAGVAPLPSETRTTTHELQAVAVNFTGSGSCRLLGLTTAAGAQIRTTGTVLQLANDPMQTHEPRGSINRSRTTIDPTRSVAASVSPQFIVSGDLHLVLWGTTGTASSPNETVRLDTGERHESYAAPAPVTRSRQVEAYLWLYDATLQVHGIAPQMYLEDATASSTTRDGRLVDARLQRSEETIAQAQIALEAPFEASLRPNGDVLRVDVWAANFPEPRPGWTALDPFRGGAQWWFVFAGFLVLLIVAVLVEHRRRLGLEQRLLARADYPRTARVAGVFSWMPLLGRNHRVARTVALLRSGDLEGVSKELRRPGRWRAMRATWHYLRAHLAVARGDVAAARDNLADCLALSPAYRKDAMADPALRHIVAEAMEALRQRTRPAGQGYS